MSKNRYILQLMVVNYFTKWTSSSTDVAFAMKSGLLEGEPIRLFSREIDCSFRLQF